LEKNKFPKLHNALWPGIVGKGPGSEPPISLATMLELTAAASVDGVRFDGIDLFLYEPHISIDITDDGIKRLADQVASFNLEIGTVVAPVWEWTGGGSAMGDTAARKRFVKQVHKASLIAKKLRDYGIRPHGVIRMDSATDVKTWAVNPTGNTKQIARTFQEACTIAADFGETLALEGEICWGGMHSWRAMIDTLHMVDRKNIGFQADMAHTLLYLLGYNSPADRILLNNFDWSDRSALDEGLKVLTAALRPWTIDFHVAQSDGTVHGTGAHDKTGRHCLATDKNGKLDIAADAGYWLRNENGELTKAFNHICWDGCMFPNAVMLQVETYNDILNAMIRIRDLHGW
jgi:hypothetical protein